MDAAFEKVLERLKNEPKEKVVERMKELGLIPKPVDWNVIKKVLGSLATRKQSVCCENLHYSPEKFDFSFEEFKNVFLWIDKYVHFCGVVEISESDFPEKDAIFSYQDSFFNWNLMIGQGSLMSIHYMYPEEISDKTKVLVLDEIEEKEKAKTDNEESVIGYHVRKIPKGKMGEWSKIREEFEECEDAIEQDIKVMVLLELSDLIGAIEAYVEKHFNTNLKDLRKMAKVTSRAFKSGKRK